MCIYIHVLYIHKYSRGGSEGGGGGEVRGGGGVKGGGKEVGLGWGGVLDTQFSPCYQNSPVLLTNYSLYFFPPLWSIF